MNRCCWNDWETIPSEKISFKANCLSMLSKWFMITSKTFTNSGLEGIWTRWSKRNVAILTLVFRSPIMSIEKRGQIFFRNKRNSNSKNVCWDWKIKHKTNNQAVQGIRSSWSYFFRSIISGGQLLHYFCDNIV